MSRVVLPRYGKLPCQVFPGNVQVSQSVYLANSHHTSDLQLAKRADVNASKSIGTGFQFLQVLTGIE